MSPLFSILSGTDFALGVFGALFVETYRLKNLTDRGEFRWGLPHLPIHLIWVLTFLAGSGLLAAVQGLSPEMSAFYAGLTAPVFFGVILKDNTKADRELEDLQREKAKSDQQRDELANEVKQLRIQLDLQNSSIKSIITGSTETISVSKTIIPRSYSNETEIVKQPLHIMTPVLINMILIMMTTFLGIVVGRYSQNNGENFEMLDWLFDNNAPQLFIVLIATIASLFLLFWVLPKLYRKSRNSRAFQTFLSGLF